MPSIAIIGGGAIGGLLAALLTRAGREVELVVRQGQEGRFREGIWVTGAAGEFRQRVSVATRPSMETALVVVTVKLPDLEAACRDLAGVWGETPGALPPVLLLQNGLDAAVIAARALPRSALLGGVVELGATALEPAAISYAIPGRLLLGAPTGGDLANVERAAALLRPALPVKRIPDLAATQRLKLLVNLNNGASAATGLTIQQLYARPAGLRLSLGLMREGLAAFDAAGLPLERSMRAAGTRRFLTLPDMLARQALRAAGARTLGRVPVYGSTLQSILRGRPTEIQALNGAVVRLGDAHGVPTPYNRGVVAAVEAVAAAGLPTPARFVSPETLVQSARASAR